MKSTPHDIHNLMPGQIFVFGSNTAGVHGKGAARTAQVLFGAQRGVAEGPTGQCYAIPTRIYIGRTPEQWNVRFEPVPLVDICRSVFRFLQYAEQNLHLEFLVTKLGCGYAGYQAEDIKPFFDDRTPNVIVPVEFQ
jgi:hypothetical protein